jgi:hypothetical protein
MDTPGAMKLRDQLTVQARRAPRCADGRIWEEKPGLSTKNDYPHHKT